MLVGGFIVFGIHVFLVQLRDIFVGRNNSGGSLVAVKLAMYTFLGPVEPHFFGSFGVDELAVLTLQEIVGGINLRNIFHALHKVNVVHGVLTQGIGDEVKVGHGAGLSDTLGTQSC